MEDQDETVPFVHSVIRQTWLSRRPDPAGWFEAAIAVLALAGGSLLYWSDLGGAGSWMPVSKEAVFHGGEIWRLWTALFAHGDPGHLLSNAALFFVFAGFLRGYFGGGVFPLAAFFFGGVINLLSVATQAPALKLIGASGMVFWMGGAWLALYVGLNRQKTLSQRLLRAAGVAVVLFLPSEAFDPSISYRTHGIGFALGAIWGVGYFLWNRRRFRSAEVVEVVVD